MTTVRLENSVFMHIPKTGGTTATLAFAEAGSITYDYRYAIDNPINNGYKYDEECRLHNHGSYLQEAKNKGSHSTINELRSQDKKLPKIVIVRNPCDWYKSYWSHHKKFNWTTVNDQYIYKDGDKNFEKWIKHMVSHSRKLGSGYFTRYLKKWVDDSTIVVRLEDLAKDMEYALSICHENLEAVKGLNKIKNRNQRTNDLRIPDNFINDIRDLDADYWV